MPSSSKSTVNRSPQFLDRYHDSIQVLQTSLCSKLEDLSASIEAGRVFSEELSLIGKNYHDESPSSHFGECLQSIGSLVSKSEDVAETMKTAISSDVYSALLEVDSDKCKEQAEDNQRHKVAQETLMKSLVSTIQAYHDYFKRGQQLFDEFLPQLESYQSNIEKEMSIVRNASVESAQTPGVVNSGYLWKKGKTRRNWCRRWFVLRKEWLCFYESEQLQSLRGACHLRYCCVDKYFVNLNLGKTSQRDSMSTFSLSISWKAHSLFLVFETLADLEEWLADIRGCIVNEEKHQVRDDNKETEGDRYVVVQAKSDWKKKDKSSALDKLLADNPEALEELLKAGLTEELGIKSPRTARGQPSSLVDLSSSTGNEQVDSVVDSDVAQDVEVAMDSQSVGKDSMKEGFLFKKGQKRRNWTQRWFILTSNMLVYYKNPVDPQPKGRIVLTKTSFVSPFSTKKNGFAIEGTADKRTYFMYATSRETKEDWVKVISKAISGLSSTPTSSSTDSAVLSN